MWQKYLNFTRKKVLLDREVMRTYLSLEKEDLKLDKVFVNGEQFVNNGKVQKWGRYEEKWHG